MCLEKLFLVQVQHCMLPRNAEKTKRRKTIQSTLVIDYKLQQNLAIACSRLLERCAKESARGRKRVGNGGEKKRERRGACNHFLQRLMPPTFSKMCQHVKMSNFSLSRVSITRASSRVCAVVHTSLRCRGH